MDHAKIAEEFLKVHGTERVFVSDSGRVWVNNSENEMREYFEGKKEGYKVFINKKKVNGAK